MDKWLYRISFILVTIGLIVAIYMTVYNLSSNDTMCLGSGDCSTVNDSPYSRVYGMPVAGIGLAGYLAILISHWLEQRARFFEQNGTMLIFGLSLTGFLFTLYLIYVEFAILNALCPFCLVSQIVMTCIFIIAIIRLVRQL